MIWIVDVFFGVGLHKLLNKQFRCIQWHFYIEGQGFQTNSSQSLDFIFVNRINLLNKQPSGFRFIIKAVFWRGYQIMTSEQRNKTLMFSVLLACTSSSTISLVASNGILHRGSGDSSQFQPKSGFHFRYLEKSVEQTIDLLQIYNESCVMKGT